MRDHSEASTRRGTLWDWLGALSGLVFVALLVAGIMIGDPNESEGRDSNPEQSGTVLAQLYSDRSDDARNGATVSAFAIFSFIAFVSYTYSKIRVSVSDWLATVALGGGLVAAGYLAFTVNLGLATAAIEDYGEDVAAARMFAALGWDSILMLGPPLAAFVAGVSASALRHAVVPRWLGWSGLPVAGLLAFLPAAFVGLMFFVPWVALVSIALLWRVWSPRAVASVTTSPAPQLS